METSIRERRYQDILHAAAEEFARCGFESTRMEAVARRAGIGKSTVYEYFPSKRELLRAVGDMMVTDLLMRVREALTAELPLHELLSRYFRCIAELAPYVGAVPPLFQNGEDVREEIKELACRFCQETLGLLHTTLRRAADRAEISRTDDLDAAALLLLSGASPVFAQGVQTGHISFEQAGAFFLRALE